MTPPRLPDEILEANLALARELGEDVTVEAYDGDGGFHVFTFSPDGTHRRRKTAPPKPGLHDAPPE